MLLGRCSRDCCTPCKNFCVFRVFCGKILRTLNICVNQCNLWENTLLGRCSRDCCKNFCVFRVFCGRILRTLNICVNQCNLWENTLLGRCNPWKNNHNTKRSASRKGSRPFLYLVFIVMSTNVVSSRAEAKSLRRETHTCVWIRAEDQQQREPYQPRCLCT